MRYVVAFAVLMIFAGTSQLKAGDQRGCPVPGVNDCVGNNGGGTRDSHNGK